MRRLSLRARITVMFVLTVLGVGLALIGLVYLYLKLTPVPFQAVLNEDDTSGAVIDAAVPITEEILRVVLTISLSVLGILTVLAGLTGWFVAGLVIRPLRDIAASAREVTSGKLATRVRYDGPHDEAAELADALNTMLDSLGAQVAAQRRFAANASHELKTPIATIQTMADVALEDPGAPKDELRETLTRVREVNAGQAETVTALLALADLEAGRKLELNPVNVSKLAAVIANNHSIDNIDIDQELYTSGDGELVRQAVDNLARNAVRHGTPGTADLRVYRNTQSAEPTNTVTIEVRNDGPHLTTEEIALLTEPFARARTGGGNGLGLALVRAIAQAHGGELTIVPGAVGGIVVKLELPDTPGN